MSQVETMKHYEIEPAHLPHHGLISSTWHATASIVRDAWKAFAPGSGASDLPSLPNLNITGVEPSCYREKHDGKTFMRNHPHLVNAAILTVDSVAAGLAAAVTVETGPGAFVTAAGAAAVTDIAVRKALGLPVTAQTIVEGAVMGVATPAAKPLMRLAATSAEPIVVAAEAVFQKVSPRAAGLAAGIVGLALPISDSLVSRTLVHRVTHSTLANQISGHAPDLVPKLDAVKLSPISPGLVQVTDRVLLPN